MTESIDEEKINQILEELEDEPKKPTSLQEEQDVEQEEENEQNERLINTDIDQALKLEFPSTVLICGSTNTGKSELMKNIIYKKL